MKIACWIGALVFFLFAAVQYNDPDPLIWMLLYGGVAVHFVLAALGIFPRPTLWLWLVAAALWNLTLVADFIFWVQMGMPSIVGTMKAEKPYIEVTREFLGLLIAILACIWLLRLAGRSVPLPTPDGR